MSSNRKNYTGFRLEYVYSTLTHSKVNVMKMLPDDIPEMVVDGTNITTAIKEKVPYVFLIGTFTFDVGPFKRHNIKVMHISTMFTSSTYVLYDLSTGATRQ